MAVALHVMWASRWKEQGWELLKCPQYIVKAFFLFSTSVIFKPTGVPNIENYTWIYFHQILNESLGQWASEFETCKLVLELHLCQISLEVSLFTVSLIY